MPLAAEMSSMCDTVEPVSQIRHFTVTAFVSTQGRTLLHWHRKVGLWLPPGGHLEPNETPVEAVVREALEETGMQVEIVPNSAPFAYSDPPQLPVPVTIMVEPIRAFGGEPAHQHMDLIYFTQPHDRDEDALPQPPDGSWRWVTRAELEDDAPQTFDDVSARISEDVRILGMAAIDHVTRYEETPA